MVEQTSVRIESPELTLLLTCAHACLTSAQQAALHGCVSLPLDWTKVITLAGQHGLLPLLYWNLTQHTKSSSSQRSVGSIPAVIPPGVLAQLTQHYHSNNLHCIKLGRALGSLVQDFADHKVPVLALKGITLAQAVYGNPALRDAGDLDLLIDPADARRAMALLESLGYQAHQPVPLTANQQKAWVHFKSEQHYHHPQHGIELDLHWRLVDQQSGFTLDFADLWARRTTVMLYNRPVATLGPEDGLLYLALHGAKHGWIALKWLCDLAETLRAHPNLAWDQIQQQATGVNALPILRQGLALAHQLMESELPHQLDHGLHCPSSVDTQYLRLLLGDPAEDTAAYLLSARESNLRLVAGQRLAFLPKIKQTLQVIGTPTGAEIQLVSLPSALILLYYPIRLGRLLWKFLQQQQG
jgi:Uncharacterised nucleotidyltransferase